MGDFRTAHILRYRYRVAQTARLRTTTHVTRDAPAAMIGADVPASAVWNAIVVQRVVGLECDGCAHLVTTSVNDHPDVRAVEGALGGQHHVSYALVDTRGRARLYSAMAAPTMHVLPLEAVAPGSEWRESTVFPLPPEGHEALVELCYRYIRNHQADGRHVAVIEFHCEPVDCTVVLPQTWQQTTIGLEMRGQIWFDPGGGVLVLDELEVTTTPRLLEEAGATTSHTARELLKLDYCAPGEGWIYPGL